MFFFLILVEGATLGVPVPIIDGKHIIIHVTIYYYYYYCNFLKDEDVVVHVIGKPLSSSVL